MHTHIYQLRVRVHVCVSFSAHDCACTRAHLCSRRNMRALSVGVDREWFGSQVFQSSSAFNADIGRWNTAAVLNMYSVCTDFGSGGRARLVFDAPRP